jgi:hypothetical protein
MAKVEWRGGGEWMELTCGARMSVAGVGEGSLHGRRNFEEIVYSEKCAKGVQKGQMG